MLKLKRIKQDERLLRAMTGLDFKELAALKPAFAEALSKAPMPHHSEQPRQRSAAEVISITRAPSGMF